VRAVTVKTTTIDLLRHGQCEGGEIFRGSTDVALTDKGWQQMQQSISNEQGWGRIISSTLMRCQKFANTLSKEKGLPLELFEAFQEIHFGDWEGQLQETVQQEQRELLRAFWKDPLTATPPNGEPMIDFHRRVTDCVNDLLATNHGEHLLLVTHGAVIRVLMCEWLNMPLTSLSSISVPYACMTRFRIYHFEDNKPWVQLCFHRGD
jgi:alpha-ribazole phosphatase